MNYRERVRELTGSAPENKKHNFISLCKIYDGTYVVKTEAERALPLTTIQSENLLKDQIRATLIN